MFSFVLNLPYTIVGIFVAIVSFPTRIVFLKEHLTFAVNVKSFWWAVLWMRGARASAFGNVVLLSPRTQEGDLEHELVHVRQYQKNPFIFPFLYYIELIKKGYRNNKYEVEAYEEAGNRYEGSEASS